MFGFGKERVRGRRNLPSTKRKRPSARSSFGGTPSKGLHVTVLTICGNFLPQNSKSAAHVCVTKNNSKNTTKQSKIEQTTESERKKREDGERGRKERKWRDEVGGGRVN